MGSHSEAVEAALSVRNYLERCTEGPVYFIRPDHRDLETLVQYVAQVQADREGRATPEVPPGPPLRCWAVNIPNDHRVQTTRVTEVQAETMSWEGGALAFRTAGELVVAYGIGAWHSVRVVQP